MYLALSINCYNENNNYIIIISKLNKDTIIAVGHGLFKALINIRKPFMLKKVTVY